MMLIVKAVECKTLKNSTIRKIIYEKGPYNTALRMFEALHFTHTHMERKSGVMSGEPWAMVARELVWKVKK